ncbi:hypothetical protein [Megalodesulfovibrio gigas]|uniref:Putative serine/threonine protein kinase n=1 Tax=Megalodesulfovibrio gigas (strain ATCC 19364 / DSM 1382 / NCIMB 9332 / VKM B-1759) TaxID=1121448 RepID=T2GB00_MEGG1|nr:hypothetical protein [Megalodesulfovibrio gigas]AGW13062.1 putative serine/threonine protein kinase [Megalodesulfovibrio gigas DSM 1382 = ATCC 19364]
MNALRMVAAWLLMAAGLVYACFVCAGHADAAETVSAAEIRALESLCLEGQPSLAMAQAAAILEQPGTADAPALLSLLGRMHDAVAEFDRAAQYHREALDNATALHGAGDPALIPYLSALAVHHIHIGDLDGASRWFETAEAVVTQGLGPEHLNAQAFLDVLSSLALLRHDPQAAQGNATRSLALAARHLWPEHPACIKAMGLLGEAMLKGGTAGAAKEMLGQAVQLGQATLGPQHPDVLGFQLLKADALAHLGALDAAAVLAREILRHAPDAWGPAWPRLVMRADVWPVVEALHRAGRREEAIALQRMRLALWDAAGLARHLGREEDRLRLALLLLHTDHAAESLEILETLLAPAVWDRLLLVHSPAALAAFEADINARVQLVRTLAQLQPHVQPRAETLLDATARRQRTWPAVQALRQRRYADTPEGLEQRRLQAMWLRMQLEGPQGVSLDLYARRLERIEARMTGPTSPVFAP